MDDLRRRFASLDRVPAPDLWDAIERRAAAAGSVARVTAVVRPVGMRVGRSNRWQLVLLLAAAALLLALLVGAFVTGSWRPDQLAILENPSPSPAATVAPLETAAPSATTMATPSPAPSPSGPPWITGGELMDALSAVYGYQWQPIESGSHTVIGYRSSQVDFGASVEVVIRASVDGPARVDVSGGVDDRTGAAQHASRVAQLLAPDVAPWVQEAITRGFDAYTQGLPAGERVSTATGGRVDVEYVDEPLIGDWMAVSFVPDPPATRALQPGRGDVVYTEPYPSGGEGARAIWVANADGTDAKLLLAGIGPVLGAAEPLGWAADGSWLYVGGGGGVEAIAADGSAATTQIACPQMVGADDCQGAVFSPDGTRLAYPVNDDSGLKAIGFFDRTTGRVTRMAFDSEKRPLGPACRGPFGGGPLQWSPDGTRLAFGSSIGPKVDGWCQGAVFTINVDGTDLRRLTSSMVHAMDPRWSPDGSTIVFSSSTPRSAWDGQTDATRIPVDRDIYSVRPDGSGLTRLTSDGVSILPLWTREGRIVFVRLERGPKGGFTGPGELRIMDADGSNATTLDTTVAAQAAAGCTVCPYFDSNNDISYRYWQPTSGDRP